MGRNLSHDTPIEEPTRSLGTSLGTTGFSATGDKLRELWTVVTSSCGDDVEYERWGLWAGELWLEKTAGCEW